MLRLSKIFICSLLLVGLVGSARADSPITSNDLVSVVDSQLGSNFSGKSYTYKQAVAEGKTLLKIIGQKGTSTGAVFDAVQAWNSVLFGVDRPGDQTKASKFFNKQLASLANNGDGGMNGVAAKHMNKIFAQLFTGNVKTVTKSADWMAFQNLKKTNKTPALYTVNGMFHHYIDMMTTYNGASPHAQEAAANWRIAANKILRSGTSASSHAREQLKGALEYSTWYEGPAYKGHSTPILLKALNNTNVSAKVRKQSLVKLNKTLPAKYKAYRTANRHN